MGQDQENLRHGLFTNSGRNSELSLETCRFEFFVLSFELIQMDDFLDMSDNDPYSNLASSDILSDSPSSETVQCVANSFRVYA